MVLDLDVHAIAIAADCCPDAREGITSEEGAITYNPH